MTDLERVRKVLVEEGAPWELVELLDAHLKEDAAREAVLRRALAEEKAAFVDARDELTELREAVRVYTDNPSSNDRLVQLDRLRQLIEEKPDMSNAADEWTDPEVRP